MSTFTPMIFMIQHVRRRRSPGYSEAIVSAALKRMSLFLPLTFLTAHLDTPSRREPIAFSSDMCYHF